MSSSEPKAERQSKIAQIDRALHNLEATCCYLEDTIGTLVGELTSDEEKQSGTTAAFLSVYEGIAYRTNEAADRIRSATDRIKEMLI